VLVPSEARSFSINGVENLTGQAGSFKRKATHSGRELEEHDMLKKQQSLVKKKAPFKGPGRLPAACKQNPGKILNN